MKTVNKSDIEKILKKLWKEDDGQPSENRIAFNEALQKVQVELDTLEEKEVNLDYIKKELDEVIRIYKPTGDFGWGTLYNVATHFFELGLKAKGE